MPVEAMNSSLFEAKDEVDQLQHDRGDIREHVLERVPSLRMRSSPR